MKYGGRIAFGECLVMSRRRWQEDQVDLRSEARKKRRAFLFPRDFDDGKEHREVLNLPMEGALKLSEINIAFRRLAKTAHPDAGGSDEGYHRIAAARDALLKQFGSALWTWGNRPATHRRERPFVHIAAGWGVSSSSSRSAMPLTQTSPSSTFTGILAKRVPLPGPFVH